MLVSCSCEFISWFGSRLDLNPPFMGCSAFSFIGEGKARVTEEEKEKNEREKKASRVAGSFSSFIRVPPIQ